MVLGSAPAQAAAPTHPLLETFGNAAQPTLGHPAEIAVDQSTGDLLVVNYEPSSLGHPNEGHGTISRFNPDGTPANFSALSSTNVIDGHAGEADATPQGGILSSESYGATEVEIAVAPPGAAGGTEGDIYVTDATNGKVDVFDSTGKYLTQLSGSFPCGVAVNPDGNVFIGNYEGNGGTGGVSKFVPSAGTPPTYTKASEYATPHPCQVAAGVGAVYVNQYEGAVTKIDSEGAGEGTTDYTISSGSNETVSLDPGSGHVYVATGTKLNEYHVGASGASLISTTEPGSALEGAAVDEGTGDVYVTRSGEEHVEVFGPDTYGPPTFELTINKTGSGTGTIECEVEASGTAEACASSYPEGTNVKLIATPGAHTEPVEWSGDCMGSGTCSLTMDAAKSVTATFDLEKRQLAVTLVGTGTGEVISSPAGIACTSETCTQQFDYGTAVKLTGIQGANTQPVAWTGCDAVNGADECEVTMEDAKSVTATFNLEKFALTVTSNGNSTGTVESTSPASPTIICGTECSTEFEYGTTVKLMATSGAHTQPVVWSGCDAVVGANECEVAVIAAKAVTATFNLEEQQLSVALSGTGTGEVTGFPGWPTCNGGTCATDYYYGTAVVLSGSPGEHSEPVVWSGCDAIVGANECEVEMAAAKSVTATFNLEERQLTVKDAGSGSGTVTSYPAGIDCGTSCSLSHDYGTAITLSAKAAAGSEFVGFSGGGCGGAASCVVTLSRDLSVVAQFRAAEGESPSRPPSNHFAIGAATPSHNGMLVELAVSVPGPGSIRATGKWLKGATAHPSGAGKLELPLRLTEGGRRALSRARGHRLEVRVKIRFTPTGGTPVSATKAVTFKRSKRHVKRSRHRRSS